MRRLKRFEEYLCAEETPIRDVLARLNATRYLFQLVVDDRRTLLGTITDGDVRRAMLGGIGLDSPAKACMFVAPQTGRSGDDRANRRKLGSFEAGRAFLPVIDDTGRLCEVLVGAPDEPAIRRALVMAGGLGTRLGERTRDTPKPLLPVGDKPILEHVLGALEGAGVEEVFVSVHYLAERIVEFVAARPSIRPISILREERQLGTAGALGLLPGRGEEPVLVVNGDLVTRVDFPALAAFHGRNGFSATVAVARYEIDVPFGVVRQGPGGMFEAIHEKPKINQFIAAGIYYLAPEFAALVPAGKRMDMPELLNLGAGLGLRVGLFPIHEYWVDVGRPDELDRADSAHRAAK